MIVDEIDRSVTQEQARVDLGELLEEIRDNRQNIKPAEVRWLTARIHADGTYLLFIPGLERTSSTAV